MHYVAFLKDHNVKYPNARFMTEIKILKSVSK